MSRLDEQLSEEFHRWEQRGRGWQVFPEPVELEPPFVPFRGHFFLPSTSGSDDGVKHTFLSSLVQRLSQKLSKEKPPVHAESDTEEEPEPTPFIRESLVELQALLPEKLDISKDGFEQFLLNLSLCHEPIAFELIGINKSVSAQFVASASDAPLLRRQLQAYFPEAIFVLRERGLEQPWDANQGDEAMVVEFGLRNEFMLPLASGKLDPFIGIVGAMAELQPDEFGLFQVLFQPVQNSWGDSIVNSVTHGDGKPFFVNQPELAGAAESKIASPLYAAVVRMMVCASVFARVVQLASDLAGSLRVFSHPSGNALIPLHNGDYPFEEHIEDVLRRQTRRTGMLLNSTELTGLVHIPSSAVRSPVFQRQTAKTKAAPKIVRQDKGLLLGENEHAGETVSVRLTPEQRVHHTHIIGASGTGKSTLLFNIIQQSIENGEGIAVLDPHGDLVDRICGIIPRERIDDVILVDPSDPEYSVGFNILSAHSDLEKNLLASDLIAVFQRLSASWGDQMNSVLQNAILAFLESDRRGTIADLNRFLIDTAYRNDFLKSVKDLYIVDYWKKSFPHLSGNKSIGSILTRLDAFLAQKPIRYMVSQPENRLDFAHIMDSGKIFLAKLPEGLLGRENSYLLGTLLVSKFQQIAMSRQAQQIESRRLFTIVIDEFANFITPSMAEILSGARKYRIGLTLAHHELHQLQRSPEVASAVMTHPYTRIVFRVGDDDAKKLAESFSSFEASDLTNLERGHAIARVERSNFDFNLSVISPETPNETAMANRRQEVITASRNKYGTARTTVEAMLRESWDVEASKPPKEKEKAPIAAPPPSPTTSASPPVEFIQPKPIEVPKSMAAGFKQKDERALSLASMPLPPRDLGRGGAQHQAIQRRIKKAADDLGFRSTIEKEILENTGSVDLLLERGDHTIACEISITTTIDHEVGNVVKCLKAGFPNIAVVCLDDEHLNKISAAVCGSLGAEVAFKVSYYQPDQFIAHLKTLGQTSKASETSRVRRGFKVKHSPSNLTAEEQKQREDVAIRAVAEAMQGRGK